MASTIILILTIFFYTQVCGSLIGMSAMSPVSPIGPGGPFGPFGPLAGNQGTLLSLKFTLLSQMLTAKRDLITASMQMKMGLSAAKNQLTLQAQNLDNLVKERTTLAQTIGKDVQACVDGYTTNSDAITAKINELDLYTADDQLTAIRNNVSSIGTILGSSKNILKQCKLQFLAATQSEDLNQCVTSGGETAQQNATNVNNVVTAGIEEFKANYATFIQETESQVNGLILKASAEFDACFTA